MSQATHNTLSSGTAGAMGAGSSTGGTSSMGTGGSMGTSGSMAGGTTGSAGRQDVQQKVQDIKQNVQDLSSTAKQMAQEQYENLRGQATDYFEQGRTRAMEIERTLESQIRDQPLKAVMMAAGIGLVLGVLWSRR